MGAWGYAYRHMDPWNGILNDPLKKSIRRQKGGLPWHVTMGVEATELSKQGEGEADTSLGLLPQKARGPCVDDRGGLT